MTGRYCLNMDEMIDVMCGWLRDEEGADDRQAVRRPTCKWSALCDNQGTMMKLKDIRNFYIDQRILN